MQTRSLRRARALPRAGGFTLMEMIAVIVLLGIVISIVGGNVMGVFGDGKHKAGTIAVKKLANAIEVYQMSVGSYPNTLDELVKRDGGKSVKQSDLKDPFGNPFVYKKPGEGGRDFDIVFLGKDNKPGGEGVDKDFGSWE
jgi:general secretion pathway protein G